MASSPGWSPSPQASWVESFNALGTNLGDAGLRSLVSLSEAELLEAAQRATGLIDFGDDGFRDGLRRLLAALEEEARLNLLGRLLARQEIQRLLQTRLQIRAAFTASPQIGEEEIRAPIFVTGLARTGTTFLHELFTADDRNRVPMLWEAMYPAPPPEAAAANTDPRIAAADREIRIMDEIVPAFPSMHENRGDLPTECIFLLAQEFATDLFSGAYEIPSYSAWMSTTDKVASYRAHRRLLQLLQFRHRRERWVLKAPSHLAQLDALFEVYPDAHVVITHRDPLRVLGSLTNLMAVLRGMRSDHVDHEAVVWQMSLGYEMLVAKVLQQRADGVLPEDRILDVAYRDLVADPVGTVRRVYDRVGVALPDRIRGQIQAHVQGRPKDKRGLHEYDFADTGLDPQAERAKYADYQQRYGVPSELEP